MKREFSDAWHAWRRAKGALSADPETYGNSGQEPLWETLYQTVDAVLTAPARAEWELQEKFLIFQNEVLDADEQGRRADHREHVWFASLMADSLRAAGGKNA